MSVLKISHETAGNFNMHARMWPFQMLREILACRNRILLRHSIDANWFYYKIAILVVEILLIEKILLPRIQLQETMPITIGLMSARVLPLSIRRIHDSSRRHDAGLLDEQSLRLVDVLPQRAVALRPRSAGGEQNEQRDRQEASHGLGPV